VAESAIVIEMYKIRRSSMRAKLQKQEARRKEVSDGINSTKALIQP
jgi:hypothetical protein